VEGRSKGRPRPGIGEALHFGDLRLVAEPVFVAEPVKRVEKVDEVVEEAVDFTSEFLSYGGVELLAFDFEMFGEKQDESVSAAPSVESAHDGEGDGRHGAERSDRIVVRDGNDLEVNQAGSSRSRFRPRPLQRWPGGIDGRRVAD